MSGVCDTCQRDRCRLRMDGLKMCDMRLSESKYERMFGTPEKAANILALGCMGAEENVCDSCVFTECDGKLRRCGSIHSIATKMLEWLESEVRDD